MGIAEIDIRFLDQYTSKKELSVNDFKNSKNIFNIFDSNHDKKLDNNEIQNLFQQIRNSSDTNKEDVRKDACSIFDNKEIEHFVNNNTNQDGKSYKSLGITLSEVYNFLGVLFDNVKGQEQKQTIKESDNFSSQIKNEEEGLAYTEEQKTQAKTFENIPTRGKEQFNKEECLLLTTLNQDQLERAKKLFYVNGRIKQLSAQEIVDIVTSGGGKYNISQESLSKIDELVVFQNSSGANLSGQDIAQILSLPTEKIDIAKQLLTLPNRQNNPLSVADVVNILNCDSEQLINDIIQNPQMNEFTTYKTNQTYFIEVMDKQKQISYRYVKGQTYPEIAQQEQIDDNTYKKIVTNQNLNIRQTYIYTTDQPDNPSSIETQFLSANGNVQRTEVYEKSDINGTPNIYTIDENGVKTYLQKANIDSSTGAKTITKSFSNEAGTTTTFSYSTTDDVNYELKYNITNSNGDVIYTKEQALKELGNNKYEYTNNDKTYVIEKKDSQLVITDKSNNNTYTINYSDYIEGNSEIFEKNMVRIPAEILVFISQNPLKLSYNNSPTCRDNQGYTRSKYKAIDIGKITKSESVDNSFITLILHEFGHYIDNPNLSKDSKDILSQNEDLRTVYNEELKEFNSNHTVEEQLVLRQFDGLEYTRKSASSQLSRTVTEMFGEATMVTNTNSKSWTAARSYYLQRYFPKTIAKVQELLNSRLNN